MKALILAAGVGSRLRPITETKPKCLVKVAGRSILDHQIRAYASAQVNEIVVVAGYMSDTIRQHCAQITGVNLRVIENPDYATTNNMYSLYLAREELKGEEFILSNGDVVFDPEIIRSLINEKLRDVIVAQSGNHNQESMKITVNQSGFICDISKTIPPEDAFGTSIDVYAFSEESARVFLGEVQTIIEKQKDLNRWTEVALQRLLQKQTLKMRPFDIKNAPWVEIDNYDDLLAAEYLFSDLTKTLFDRKLFFVDLDGTTYLGDAKIEGAREFVETLDRKNILYYFLSNNSSRSKKDYVKRLKSVGIDAVEENIILSTDGLVEYLKDNKMEEVFLVGTESMRDYLERAGIGTRSSSPQCVVLGYDRELTYEKLRRAALHIIAGLPLFATHADVVCPTADGPIPDIGSIMALLEKATGVKPRKIFGKPNKEMVEHVMRKHDVVGREAVIIGDRLYTDMELAKRSGARFVLVLSGETTRQDIEDQADWPDLVVRSLRDLC